MHNPVAYRILCFPRTVKFIISTSYIDNTNLIKVSDFSISLFISDITNSHAFCYNRLVSWISRDNEITAHHSYVQYRINKKNKPETKYEDEEINRYKLSPNFVRTPNLVPFNFSALELGVLEASQ